MKALVTCLILAALAVACGASFTGSANPPVAECGGHCVCGAGCCYLAQIDCAGVLCHGAGDPTVCEYTGEGIGPADVGAKRRDGGFTR